MYTIVIEPDRRKADEFWMKRFGKGQAAMEKKNIFNLLWDACDIADRMEYQQANAASEIESVMGDMQAMKNVVNSRDVTRWYARLDSALAYLEGGKHNETD